MCDSQADQPMGDHVEAGKRQGACDAFWYQMFDQDACWL
jgi:hypothetical protein